MKIPKKHLLSIILFACSNGIMAQVVNSDSCKEDGIRAVDIIPAEQARAVNNPAKEPPHHFYIKTNLASWLLAISNVSLEMDLARHWSCTLPISFSAWDYFKSTIKFRTFSLYPEVRYWLSEDNNGWFTGAHFGLVFYNFAFNGDYRYQGHNSDKPATGGGVSIGYRMPFCKNDRWRLEFSLGAGVYPLHYNKFRNTSETKHGLLIESVKKTYFGIDQIAVSFSYMFDLKKKGGKQ